MRIKFLKNWFIALLLFFAFTIPICAEGVSSVVVNGNMTFYQFRQANTYTVTYEVFGGTVSPTTDIVTFDSTYAGHLPTPTRIGYDFDGWFLEDTFSTPVTESTQVKTPNDHTLYAKWIAHTHNVTYNYNGGQISETPISVVTYGTPFTVQNPTKRGYNFAGWTITGMDGNEHTIGSEIRNENTLTGIKATSFNNLNATIGSTVNFEAIWQAQTFTVSYLPNNGTGTMSPQTATYDQAFTVAANGFTRSGYTFKQWSTKNDADDGYGWTGWIGLWVYINGQYGIASNKLDLYALWNINTYTITWNLNGGNLSGQKTTYTVEDVDYTLPTPSKTGYDFSGWYTSSDFSGSAVTSIPKGSTGNKTFYAKWTPHIYSINYNTNGGTLPVGYKDTYTIEDSNFDLPIPTKDNAVFLGWYTTPTSTDGTKKETVTTGSTGDITVYARYLFWTDKTYDVFYSDESQTFDITGLDRPSDDTDDGDDVTFAGSSAPLSINNNGTVTIDAGTKSGKYSFNVTATDSSSGATITKLVTVYVKPSMADKYNGDPSQTVVGMAIGERSFIFYMKGLDKTVNSATFAEGVITLPEKSNGDLLGYFAGALTNEFDGSSTDLLITIRVNDRDFEYLIKLTKVPKVLMVFDANTIYNRQEQTPNFYLPDGTTGYENQADLFTWEIIGNGLVENGGATTAKNVWLNNGSVVPYQLKIAVKDPDNLRINDSNTTETVVNFVINPFEITSENTRIENLDLIYTGFSPEVKPSVYTTINSDEKLLEQDKEYIIKYNSTEDNYGVNVGSYNIRIVGVGNYTGEISSAFNVVSKDISDSNDPLIIIENIPDQYWTGSEIRPEVNIKYKSNQEFEYTLVKGLDYDLSYTNNVEIGTATITITGKGNFAGERNVNFSIVPNKFDKFVHVVNGMATYSGNLTDGGAKVEVSSEYEPKTQYTISYGLTEGNYDSTVIPKFVNAGKYDVYFKISGKGYQDYLSKLTITINPTSNKLTIHDNDNNEVTSTKVTFPENQTFGFTLIYDVNVIASSNDYVDININNDNNTITFIPKKAGTTNVEFTAPPITDETGTIINVSEAKVSFYVKVVNGTIIDSTNDKEVSYDGNFHSIDMNYNPSDASLEYLPSDLTTSYKNAGTYIINYQLSKNGYDTLRNSKVLTILPWTITADMIEVNLTKNEGMYETEYNGTSIEPTINVYDDRIDDNGNPYKLIEGTDYTVSYSNNTLPGEAQIHVIGINNYQGKVDVPFTIKAKNLSIITHSYEVDYTGYETNGKKEDRDRAVEVITQGNFNVTYCTIDTDSAQRKANCDDENNYSVSIPKFKNVGVHTVYVKVSAVGYKTANDNFTITINKLKMKVPEVSEPEGYIYTAIIQEPSWIGLNTNFVEKIGVSRATQPGTYEEIFHLTDPFNTTWILEDGTETVEDQKRTWTIISKSIKDHETVIDEYISYNEYKQLEVQDGKVTFDRTGYVQTAWAEDCVDAAPSGPHNISERTCNYNKLISLEDESLNTESACKSAGERWNNGKCYHVNLLDIGSSISGIYVEKTTNSIMNVQQKDVLTNEYYDENKNDQFDLYAVWSRIIYRVRYELCDGLDCGKFDTSITTVVSYDQEFTVPNPKRLGYIFTGWSITGMDNTSHVINGITTTEDSYEVPKDWVQQGVPTYKNLTSLEDATVTFTATWEPVEWTMIYDSNRGTYKENAYTTFDLAPTTTSVPTGTIENQRMSFDNPVNLRDNNYSMTGYTFNGFSTSPNGLNSNGAACQVYDYNLLRPYEYVKEDNSECLTFTTEFLNRTEDKNKVQNLTIKDGDEIYLYAQWTPNENTKFVVNYWQQNIGKGDEYNYINYKLLGSETYYGLTDGMVTLQPYYYADNRVQDNLSTSALNIDKNLINTSPIDNVVKQSVISSLPQNDYYLSQFNVVADVGNPTITNDDFRGFTLRYPNIEENPESSTQITDGYHTKLLDTYTFVIKPDGSTIVNVYYTRNVYNLIIVTNQEDPENNDGNINNREYGIAVSLNVPINDSGVNGSLVQNGQNKYNDAGYMNSNGLNGSNNSGLANFQAWYYDENLTNQIVYIDSEITTHERIWARWYQYRYTNARNNKWDNWGKMDE